MTVAEAPRARLSGLIQEPWMAARLSVVPVPVCMLVFGYAPLLVLRSRVLFDCPHLAAFPMAVIAGLLLAWKSSRRLGRLEPGAGSWSVAAVGLSVVALVVAGFSAWGWLGTAAAMTTLVAAAHGIGGARLTRAVLPALVFVALAVLVPLGAEVWLIGKLQTLVTACGGPVLDALGVFHLTEGNVIKITSRPLMLEQACSGVSSLFTAIGVTLFYVLWMGRKPVPAVALVLAAAFWVVLGNIVRVVVVVFAEARWGVDLASGWRHEVWGLIIFAAVMGLTLSTDHFLRFLEALTTIRLSWPSVCEPWSGLLLMPSVQNVSDIPTEGDSRVIVAVLDDVLHFRIIGGGGCAIVDTDEKRLPEQALAIAYLRKQLEGLWPPHEVTDSERVRVIALVTSIVDHTRERSGLGSRSSANRRSPTGLAAGDGLTPTAFPGVGRTWVGSRRLGSVFAALGLLQVVWLWPALVRAVGTDRADGSVQPLVVALQSLNDGDLPDHLGPYVRTGFENEVRGTESSFGEFSRKWNYRSGRVPAIASVDFPFRGWHELTDCYKGVGWTVKDRIVRTGDGPDEAGGGWCVEAKLERLPGRHVHAALIFGIDDMRGVDLEPPHSGGPVWFGNRLEILRFARGRLGADADFGSESMTNGYQLQLLIKTAAPLSADQWTEARAIFAQLRREVRRRVASASATGAKGRSR